MFQLKSKILTGSSFLYFEFKNAVLEITLQYVPVTAVLLEVFV